MTINILRKLGAMGAISLFISLLLSGCASRFDVTVAAPVLALDTTNPVVPTLAAALKKNPNANSFNVVWKIVPDKTKPGEAILHWMVYDRAAKTLALHRDRPQYERYSGVTDALIQGVAARRESIGSLVAAGCTQTMIDEKKGG